MRVSFRVNGDPIVVEVEPRLHLADCLRDMLTRLRRFDPASHNFRSASD